jgi:hypothetical protein
VGIARARRSAGRWVRDAAAGFGVILRVQAAANVVEAIVRVDDDAGADDGAQLLEDGAVVAGFTFVVPQPISSPVKIPCAVPLANSGSIGAAQRESASRHCGWR